jgi:hypothetical protein
MRHDGNPTARQHREAIRFMAQDTPANGLECCRFSSTDGRSGWDWQVGLEGQSEPLVMGQELTQGPNRQTFSGKNRNTLRLKLLRNTGLRSCCDKGFPGALSERSSIPGERRNIIASSRDRNYNQERIGCGIRRNRRQDV